MADWNINKPLGKCCGSGREISDNEDYFAALIETSDGFERRDYCCEYWHENKPEVYCYWKSCLIPDQEKKQLFIDDDMLMAFFKRLESEDESQKVNLRFVLMLILMRKRLLKYDSSSEHGDKEIWRLKVAGEKNYVEVLNPKMDQQQIDQLSEQLGSILHSDMNDE
jgi:hypothetical protein